MKNLVVIGSAAVLVCAVTGVVIVKRHAAREAAVQAANAKPIAQPTANQPAPLEPTLTPTANPDTSPPPTTVLKHPPEIVPAPQTPLRARAASATPTKEPVTDQLARICLSFVGDDPDAEEYWAGAINNPDLPASERQDLIEDLNEDGFGDPKHPTPNELPLILNRLLLIEMLAPGAMDDVNANAFAEAYKDLLNMVQLALGGGQPVR